MRYSSRLPYLVFGGIALIVVYHVLSGAYHLWLSPPPVINLSINYTYWLFAGSGLLDITSTGAFYFLFLMSVPLVLVLHRHRQAVWVFSALFGSYIVTFNVLAGHHYHSMVGAFALTIPFWFKSDKSFELAWAAVRFYACFIFASAALWKIWRGSVFHHGHFANLIKAEHTSYLIQEPDTFIARIMYFIIAHPWVGDVLFALVTIIQLSYLTGFFTRRFDGLLLVSLCALVIGFRIVFDIASWETLILGVCFLPRKWLMAGARARADVGIRATTSELEPRTLNPR